MLIDPDSKVLAPMPGDTCLVELVNLIGEEASQDNRLERDCRACDSIDDRKHALARWIFIENWIVYSIGIWVMRNRILVVTFASIPTECLKLADGRKLFASPAHPTADGRALSDLLPGDLLDGSRITQIEQTVYTGGATYDILPSGPTGFYWANGILLGSTLAGT